MHDPDTSRFPPRPGFHGSTGTFLASVAALSLLSVTSHHEGHHSHNTIQLHNSRVLARYTPSLPEQRLLSFGHGTRATVRDLFGAMPVRVKQRAASDDRTAASRDWDHLKIAVVALMLPWSSQVSISLRDSINQQSVVIRNHDRIAPSFSDHLCRSALISRITGLLGQAGLSEETSRESWVALKASAGPVSVHGVVCLIPVVTRRIQFISIGIQPLSNERGSNVLYEEVNSMFANSGFGVEEEISHMDETERARRANDQRYKTDGFTNRELKGKRSIERWPMFYICIDPGTPQGQFAGHDLEEILDDRQRSLQAIVDVLKATIYEFLKKHHFRPVHYKKRKRASPKPTISRDKSNQPSPGRNTLALPSRPASGPSSHPKHSVTVHTGDLAATQLFLPSPGERIQRLESPSDGWSGIRRGRRMPAAKNPDLSVPATQAADANPLDITTQEISDPPLFDSSGNLVRAPFLDAEQPTPPDPGDGSNFLSTQDTEHPSEIDDQVTWVNPVTLQRSTISSRTGFQIFPNGSNKTGPPRLTSIKRLRTTEPQRSSDHDDTWLGELLSSWKNPVFETAEPPIPAAFDEAKLASSFNSFRCTQHWCEHTILDGAFRVEGRVSKDALRRAEIISQVDRKFILVKLPLLEDTTVRDVGSKASMLVIIDQHAADERCRVEALMKDYFTMATSSGTPTIQAKTEPLDPILQYEISPQERSLFDRYASYFDYWGITYQVTPVSGDQLKKSMPPLFLKVLQLPCSIAERCRTEPRLLVDLLRKEAWKLDEGGHNRSTTAPAAPTIASPIASGSHWLLKLHDCPQSIVDMVNSRACRSAIMFNDALSLDECKRLLLRLAECTFPFQCAHGRPSMVPLVDLGDSNTAWAERTKRVSFGKQFRLWKESCHRGPSKPEAT